MYLILKFFNIQLCVSYDWKVTDVFRFATNGEEAFPVAMVCVC